jgi:glucose/mannose-6-phosphate isomerase
MNLDNTKAFKELDPQNMIAEIDGLPDQLADAWALGNQLPLSADEDIRQVLIAGMGGSAIGADLLAAYVEPLCRVPIIVQRDYALPAWARGHETLVVASSHSGNTEETLSVFEQAVENNCSLIAITTGGTLLEAAKDAKAQIWQFEHKGQPRAAVGYSFGLLLALFSRLSLIPDPTDELTKTISMMKTEQGALRVDSPTMQNPAKRLAGQCYGRWVTVMGSEFLSPVARRWKGQISEIAKAWAQFEFLPEADHNTLAGVVNPSEMLNSTMILFLRARAYHPRNQLRTNITKEIFMLEGMGTDFFNAQGDSRLAQLWTTLHFGDYLSYYLAMAYGVDPTPVEAIEGLKVRLRE